MEQLINLELKAELLSPVYRPAVITWNRLEGRPRQENFDRSLRAEIRDPLWMICRQWQFGEFKGEDAGSAIKAKVQVNTASLNRYAGRSQEAVGYNDSLPLETRVEREFVPFDLMTRAQMGTHWFKLLEKVNDIGDVEEKYLKKFSFLEPENESEEEIQLRSDHKSWQALMTLKGRVVDGARLYLAIRSEEKEHEIWLGDNFTEEERNKILEVVQEFVAWFGRVYSQPDDIDDTSWSDSYLEYQFACAAPADKAGTDQTVLVAEQYHHGHLDWYSVDIGDRRETRLIDRRGESVMDAGLVEEKPVSFIPNTIEFPGMPNVRWWEFEDSRINLGKINPSTSDLATLILAEFGLVYGNDWCLVPYDLEVGTLSEVQGIVVTDVFGVRTSIRPAADTAETDRTRWGMYYLNVIKSNQIDRRLFLPPTVGKILESSPLERVVLARDEMANMVWGIEDVIPSIVSGGRNGSEAATDLERFLLAKTTPSPETNNVDTDAMIEYKLGTQVPENWIPFIPVHNPGSNRDIRLQRAAMPRLIPGASDKPVEPRGTILHSGLDETPRQPYFFHDEEVSKAGVQITRTYQRVRWWDGKIYTWLGRRKSTGKGQGSSGLEFDRIAPVENKVSE